MNAADPVVAVEPLEVDEEEEEDDDPSTLAASSPPKLARRTRTFADDAAAASSCRVASPASSCRVDDALPSCLEVDASRSTRCWYCWLPLPPTDGECPRWGVPLRRGTDIVYRDFLTPDKNVRIFRTHAVDRNALVTEGTFCSPSCVLAHVQSSPRDRQALYHESLPLLLHATGLERIDPSPCRWLLSEFGGPWSESEYRRRQPPPSRGGPPRDNDADAALSAAARFSAHLLQPVSLVSRLCDARGRAPPSSPVPPPHI